MTLSLIHISAGARVEDIRLFKQYIGEGVKIKAAGGVKTKEDLETFLEEGCDRIGTSSALDVYKRQPWSDGRALPGW